MKQKIRLSESQLKNLVKESVKRVLKESYDYDEYEEIVNELQESFDECRNNITRLQKWYSANVEHSNDLYNSYAGKYGDEAKHLLDKSYSRLGDMLEVDEEF